MQCVRVEPKGRLKLPPRVLEYIRAFGDDRVFVTSLDGITARIYPLPVWIHNEKVLQASGPLAKDARHINLMANMYGEESEIDGNGRIMLPTNLRRDLDLEGKPVWLSCTKGRVTMMNERQMQEAFQAAREAAPAALESLESAGLL
jgi:MraZ protein